MDQEKRNLERAALPTAFEQAKLARQEERAAGTSDLSGPITKRHALALHYGQVIYHVRLRNSDGTPLRARVTGKVKTWKTRPESFRVPLKHGMYDYLDVTESDGARWRLSEKEATCGDATLCERAGEE